MKKWIMYGFGFLAAVVAFNPAMAQLFDQARDVPSQLQGVAYGGSFKAALKHFLEYALFFLAIIATIFIVYGGFLYVTSAGDEGGAEKGKKILIYAVIGIVIIFISWSLVNTMLQSGFQTNPV